VKKAPTYYVYIAECADKTYYTGQTENIALHTKEHNGEGKIPGPEYTSTRRPVTIVHLEEYQTMGFAAQREKELQKLTPEEKYDLINCLAIH
jgi:putative endonuclease